MSGTASRIISFSQVRGKFARRRLRMAAVRVATERPDVADPRLRGSNKISDGPIGSCRLLTSDPPPPRGQASRRSRGGGRGADVPRASNGAATDVVASPVVGRLQDLVRSYQALGSACDTTRLQAPSTSEAVLTDKPPTYPGAEALQTTNLDSSEKTSSWTDRWPHSK